MPTGPPSIGRPLIPKPHHDNIITLYIYVVCSALFLHIVAAVFSHCNRGTLMHFHCPLVTIWFCPWFTRKLCITPCISHILCAFLYTNSKYIIKPRCPVSLSPSPPFSPCGAARKPGNLIELSRCIASPLPASCPQALEYSF